MEIRFWGVRGSIAVPGADTVRIGGNTSCVEIRVGRHGLIFDAGTGLRRLGHAMVRRRLHQHECHLFLSHFHLDHLAGLPFFHPLYKKRFTIHLYGPKGERQSVRQNIGLLFKTEFFPVPLAQLPATLRLHSLGEQVIRVKPFQIESFYLNHPGQTLGYVIRTQKHRVAYVTDHEPIREYRHLRNINVAQYEAKLLNVLQYADVLIHDAHYLDRQYAYHRGWGHSPWRYPIHLAAQAGVRNVVLFHHDPELSDQRLRRAFAQLKRRHRSRDLTIHLAREDWVITL